MICPAGAQANADNTDCELCPEGFYKKEEGPEECVACTGVGNRTTLADGAKANGECVSK